MLIKLFDAAYEVLYCIIPDATYKVSHTTGVLPNRCRFPKEKISEFQGKLGPG